MLRCAKISCPEKPSFVCICRNEEKYYCNMDLANHLRDTSTRHDPKPIAKQLDQKVAAIVVSSLEKLKVDINQQHKRVLEDFSRSMTLLEEKARSVMRSLSDCEKSVEKAISDVKTGANALESSNLNRVLDLSLEEAKIECTDWQLVNVCMNSDDLRTSIKEWARIESDLDYLFTERQRTVKTETKAPKTVSYDNYPQAHQKTESLSLGPKSNDEYPPAFQKKERLSTGPEKQDSPAKPNPPIARASTLKVLKCQKNHELKWSVTTSFAYYAKTKSFWISCDLCKSTYSKSGWNCRECSYDVCEECGLKQGAGCPKVKCPSNHELLWRPDVNMHYEFKGKGHNYSCSRCKSQKDDPHWHCRQCEFDICQTCGTDLGYIPIIPKIACKNSHSLQEETLNGIMIGNSTIGMKCKCCQKAFVGKCFTCNPCSYIICPECYDFFKRPAAGHPVLRCQDGHLLRWAATSAFVCDYCCSKKTQERYRCKECDFDACTECADILVNLVLKNDSKTHGQNGHPLVWNANPSLRTGGNPVDCNLCSIKFRKAGMFSCTMCANNYCVLCFNNPNRPKPQVQQRDIGQDLLAMHLLAGLLRPN